MKKGDGTLKMVIGNTEYTVRMHFKESGETLTDKMKRILEREVKYSYHDLPDDEPEDQVMDKPKPSQANPLLPKLMK